MLLYQSPPLPEWMQAPEVTTTRLDAVLIADAEQYKLGPMSSLPLVTEKFVTAGTARALNLARTGLATTWGSSLTAARTACLTAFASRGASSGLAASIRSGVQ